MSNWNLLNRAFRTKRERSTLVAAFACLALIPAFQNCSSGFSSDAGATLAPPPDDAWTSAPVSGSALTTIGTMTAGSKQLLLSEALDFKNGQGVLINRAGPLPTVGTPTIGNLTPINRPGSTTYIYRLAGVDNAGGVTAASPIMSIGNGPTTIGETLADLLGTAAIEVTWVPGAGTMCTAVWRSVAGGPYQLLGCFGGGSITDQGIPAQSIFWIPSTPPDTAQSGWLVGTVVSGGGTSSLTLSTAAASSVSSVLVQHDDTSALTGYLANVDEALLPEGTYRVTALALPASLSVLKGAGEATTVISASAQLTNGLASGVSISPTGKFSMSGLAIESVASSAYSGMTLNGGSDATIDACRFGGLNGLVVRGRAERLVVSNSIIDVWWDNGIYEADGNSNTYRANIVKQVVGPAGGFYRHPGNLTSVWNTGIISLGWNTLIEENSVYPVGSTWGLSCQAPGTGCRIRNNSIWYSGHECITAAQTDFALTGNICEWEPAGAQKYSNYDFGISIVSAGQTASGLISGNKISNTAFPAIALAGSYNQDSSSITGVHIVDNVLSGIVQLPGFLTCGIMINGTNAQGNSVGTNVFSNPTGHMTYNACEENWVPYGVPNNNAFRLQGGSVGTGGNVRVLGAGSSVN